MSKLVKFPLKNKLKLKSKKHFQELYNVMEYKIPLNITQARNFKFLKQIIIYIALLLLILLKLIVSIMLSSTNKLNFSFLTK